MRPSPSSDTGQGETTSSTAPEGSGTSPPRPSAAARALENAMRARLGLPEPVAPSSPEPPASQDAGATEEKPQPVETTGLRRPAVARFVISVGSADSGGCLSSGRMVWVVFDRPQELDLGLLGRLGGQSLKIIEQIPSRSATVVRMLIEPGYNPSVRREGLLWVGDICVSHGDRRNRDHGLAAKPVGPRLFRFRKVGGPWFWKIRRLGPHYVPSLRLESVFIRVIGFLTWISTTVQGILVKPHTDRIIVNSTLMNVTLAGVGIFAEPGAG